MMPRKRNRRITEPRSKDLCLMKRLMIRNDRPKRANRADKRRLFHNFVAGVTGELSGELSGK